MDIVSLGLDDLSAISSLVSNLSSRFDSIEDREFLDESVIYAHELPRSLRRRLNLFRINETGGLVVRGYQVDNERIGPTPAHWKDVDIPSSCLEEEMFFFLCSALLGDPIGWATQQDGRLMHNVLPIKGHEKEQLGSGSEVLLTWHTEDAFHPLRTDYVALMCLRNPDLVCTTYASVDDIQLPDEIVSRLRERSYPIRPDRSHLPENLGDMGQLCASERELLERSYEWISALDASPERAAVLFGDRRSPYLRVDPYFMEDTYASKSSGAALDALIAEIDRALSEYALKPGDILFLDNYKVVHGRVPFKARFDGTDRWLKRLNITRDMRKSRDHRLSASGRVIY